MSALAWAAGVSAAAAVVSGVAAWTVRHDVDVVTMLGAGGGRRTSLSRVRRSFVRIGRAPILRRASPPGIDERLEVAGWDVRPEEVTGAEIVAAALVALALGIAPSPLPLLAPLAVVITLRLPAVILTRAGARRRALAQRELPSVLDMLSAAASAGVPGPLALRRAVGVTDGPLARELRRAFDRVDLGGRWREQVDGIAERLYLPDLRRLSATLGRGEALGSTMTEAITSLADDVREERRAAAADRARRAPVKMLFPLVFLVLPAFLLLTVVPVLVTTLGSIR